MRFILLLCLSVGFISTAEASNNTDLDFMPQAQAVKMGCRGASLGEPAARKPLVLPVTASRIREIQDARDKRTGVKTEHVQVTYREAIENLEPIQAPRCGNGIKPRAKTN